MSQDLKQAMERLETKEYTCVLCHGEQFFCSCERGVKPLLKWLEDGSIPRGFSAADKVVGRAAAFLYILLGARAVYAEIMSEPACQILETHHIEYKARHTVPAIRNRAGDGFCPMESAVLHIDEPKAALAAIQKKLQSLQNHAPSGA